MKTEISSLQIITNLVMAEDLLSKAKKQLSEGKVVDIKYYNETLKYASKFILESQI